VDVPRKHRLDSVAGDRSQIGIVNASGSQMGDVAVTALVGADV